ncbi:MAG TPA: 3-hydroxyacyl-CoA dehydrogenase NAD-binding domain-containing protein [Candidatus Saccharimonadales bacterium]|nr:3-hydroxyacyl-CoA dehydrogenase NAD-binding domain-containing protein [Candidatus Saccharimonadales bacterium]
MDSQANALIPVGVVGAGTMGAGIAQVAAVAGHRVVVVDADAAAANSVPGRVAGALERLAQKGRITGAQRDAALGRLAAGRTLQDLAGAGLVIEAISEDLSAKRGLMGSLGEVLAGGAVVATNTSSLSVTAVAGAYRRPGKVLGMHFFNPAPAMELVEVVPALQTSPDTVAEALALARAWGKDPIVVRDTPGFLVNRVARPFYGEALRMVEEGLARPEEVDAAVTAAGGFRMGPFELMDLIGNDVNHAVTEAIFQRTYFDRRYLPSALQRQYVEAGYLGRKSGRGFYAYPPGPNGRPPVAEDQAQRITRRILALLINEAAEAVRLGLAAPDDIERAMTKATHYPKGLLRWADEIGIGNVVGELEALLERYGDPRYRPSPLLKSMAREGASFF